MKTSVLDNILLNERGIALNPATGETYRLTGTAIVLLKLLKEGLEPDELLQHLVTEYDVEESTAKRDLDSFLATLERMNWVEVQS